MASPASGSLRDRARRLTRAAAMKVAMAVALTVALSALPASAPAQDDSCAYAGDGLCQTWPFAALERFCVPGTDQGDCRGREVLFGSDSQPIVPERLFGQTPGWLRLARNEIYARSGHVFQSDDLAAFFATLDWYRPGAAGRDLSAVEQANVTTILAAEAAPLGEFSAAGWPVAEGTWRALLRVDGAAPVPIFGSPTTLRIGAPGADQVTFVNLTEAFLHLQDGWSGIGVGQGALPEFVYPDPVWLEGMEAEIVSVDIAADARIFHLRAAPDWAGKSVILEGQVTVSQDGIVLAGRFGWLWQECCGGEATEWVAVDFRLEGLARGPVDPALFVPDRLVAWNYPG